MSREAGRYETRAVLAGAYIRGVGRPGQTCLTHRVLLGEDGEPMLVDCGGAKVWNLADRFGCDPLSIPTCKRCASKRRREERTR